jgi:hypothetical protein
MWLEEKTWPEREKGGFETVSWGLLLRKKTVET